MLFLKSLYLDLSSSSYTIFLAGCLKETAPRLFADDTNLTTFDETIEEIESAMSVNEWLLANEF